MTDVKVSRSPRLGLQVVTHRMMGDERGQFSIPVELAGMEAAGLVLNGPLRQLNISRTWERGTTRGLHVSNTGKFCFAPLGGTSFWNPVVDLTNPKSPTYGKWEVFELKTGMAIYVPPGYGNGLQAMYGDTTYMYLLDGDFDPDAERVVDLHDPFIGIKWPSTPINLSYKDKAGLSLLDYTNQL